MTALPQSLRQHLLRSGLNLTPDSIDMHIENGTITSQVGQGNQSFAINYQINLLIKDTNTPLNNISYVLLKWLDKYNPNRNPEAMSFVAQPLNETAYDYSFSIPFVEFIQAATDANGTTLSNVNIPTFIETGNPFKGATHIHTP